MEMTAFALLAVAARGLAAAGFVGGVVALMERASPFIGGVVLALPIVTAPAYVFIILHQDAGFVAQAASEYEALLPLLDSKRQAYLYAAVLSNYGFCLIALGDFDRALDLHTKALDLFTQSGDESERATQLAALGKEKAHRVLRWAVDVDPLAI